MTINEAARASYIPLSTLYNHNNGFCGLKSTTFGRATALNNSIENRIAELFNGNFRHLVVNYVNSNKIKIPFKDEFPYQDWWLSFSKRHRLSIKKPQMVEHSRKKMCDPFIMYGYGRRWLN